MATPSKGLLAVWTDIEPSAEADFNAWYDREHLGERAAVPGFLNARRYGAAAGAPAYFAAYDTESLAVLGSPTYVHALNNQTEWSRAQFPRFRNNTRMIGALVADLGEGIGGAMLTLRLEPGVDGPRALAERLGALLEPTAALPGIVRASVALGVVAGLDADPAQPARLAAEAPDAVALLVEGSDLPALERAAEGPLRDVALREAGATDILQSARYRMLCTVVGRTPA